MPMLEQGGSHLDHNHGRDETAPEGPSTELAELPALAWE